MKLRNIPEMLLITLIMIFITVGCAPSLSVVKATVTSSSAHTPSTTPSHTLKPTLPELTQVSPIATITPFPSDTPVPISTMTPLPTLPPEAAQNLTLELMVTNGGCKLPCWWGLTPGETLWSDAFQFLQTFTTFDYERVGNEEEASYLLSYQLPGQDSSYSILGFKVIEGVITGIDVGERGMELSYQLDKLLLTYGAPGEIYFQHFWLGEIGVLRLHLILFYPDKRIVATYVVVTEVSETTYRSCFEGVGPQLILWEPNPEIEIALDILGEQYLEEFLSIEETGMTIESFYSTFTDLENHPCLEVPAP